MDEFWKSILSSAGSQGITVSLLFAAVYFLNKQNQSVEALRQKERQDLHAEMKDRVEKLEVAIDECEKDRIKLRDEMLRHFSGGMMGRG
jgi:hypothetical protein